LRVIEVKFVHLLCEKFNIKRETRTLRAIPALIGYKFLHIKQNNSFKIVSESSWPKNLIILVSVETLQ